MWPTTEHEVSVHPTLCDMPLVIKCRFLLSKLGHRIESYERQLLGLEFICLCGLESIFLRHLAAVANLSSLQHC